LAQVIGIVIGIVIAIVIVTIVIVRIFAALVHTIAIGSRILELSRIVMAAGTAPAAYDIELVGINGTVITTFTFEELEWETVGWLVGAMEENHVGGVPGARTDDDGVFMERFKLVAGNQCMEHDLYVLDYFRTPDHDLNPPALPLRITLVKVEVSKAKRRRLATRSLSCREHA